MRVILALGLLVLLARPTAAVVPTGVDVNHVRDGTWTVASNGATREESGTLTVRVTALGQADWSVSTGTATYECVAGEPAYAPTAPVTGTRIVALHLPGGECAIDRGDDGAFRPTFRLPLLRVDDQEIVLLEGAGVFAAIPPTPAGALVVCLGRPGEPLIVSTNGSCD